MERLKIEDVAAFVPAELLEKARAAEAKLPTGDAQAEADLAEFYMYLGSTLQNPHRAYDIGLTFAESAAAKGNGDGLWILAQAYEQGLGVDIRPERALVLYRKAAAQGHPAAQRSLDRLSRKEN